MVLCLLIKLAYLTSLLTFAARTLHKHLSLSHLITTQAITWTSLYHLIHLTTSPSWIIKFTIKYTKNHITNTCIHIFHLIIHAWHIFTGIIKTETIRYSRLSGTPDDYDFIHKLFSLRLIALNYPDKLISEHSFLWLTNRQTETDCLLQNFIQQRETDRQNRH